MVLRAISPVSDIGAVRQYAQSDTFILVVRNLAQVTSGAFLV